jgi:hypothetical protein
VDPYLNDEPPETWPWQLKLWLILCGCLVVELVVIALVWAL